MRPQTCFACVLLGSVILIPACRKEHDPVYDTDRNLGSENEPLLPNELLLAYDEDRFTGRVGEPDLSHLKPPPEPEEPDEADAPGGAGDEGINSEIQALVERHNELKKAEEYAQATELYKEEYRDLVRQNFDLLKKLTQIVDQVGDASPMMTALKTQMNADMKVASTKQVNEDKIVATIGMGMMPPMPWVFERVDGQWYFVGQQGLTEDKLDQLSKVLDEVSQQCDTIQAGLEDGSLDAQSAAGQLQQTLVALSTKMMQAMQSEGPSTPEPVSDEPPEETEHPNEEDSGEEDTPADE